MVISKMQKATLIATNTLESLWAEMRNNSVLN